MICCQNNNGYSSICHALKTKNFEAFELLQSIVMKSETTFISITFISELEKVVNRFTKEGITKFKNTNKCNTKPITGLMKMNGREKFFQANSTFLESYKDNAGHTVFEEPTQDY